MRRRRTVLEGGDLIGLREINLVLFFVAVPVSMLAFFIGSLTDSGWFMLAAVAEAVTGACSLATGTTAR